MEPASPETDTLILVSINSSGQVNFSTKGPVVANIRLTADVGGKKYTFIVSSDDQDDTAVEQSSDSTEIQSAHGQPQPYERPPNQPNGYQLHKISRRIDFLEG